MVAQQQMNPADVNYLNLEPIINILENNKDAKDYFPHDKEEASDAIQTVIAQYGYTPEFSDFRKQVGAVTSSS